MKNYITKFILIELFLSIIIIDIHAQITQLPSPINVENASQKNPMVSPDGNYLVFVSDRSGDWNLFISKIAVDSWGSPKMVNSVKEYFSEGKIIEGPAFNYDASRIYFSYYPQDEKQQSDIYYVDKQAEKWSQPVKMPKAINSENYDGMPSISANNSYFYFVRAEENKDDDFEKEYDCKAVYLSKRNLKGSWNKAQKMANPINKKCESSPRILPDNNTLLLSSVRRVAGMDSLSYEEFPRGGFDMFVTNRFFKHIWWIPELMKLNSIDNDECGTVDIYQKYFFFSRTDKKGKSVIYYKHDMKKILGDMLAVKGNVTDFYSNTPVDAYIDVIDPNTRKTINRYSSNYDGKFYVLLNEGKEYILDFYKENYSHSFHNVDASYLESTTTKNIDVKIYDKVELLCNIYDKDIFEPLTVDIEVKKKTNQKKIQTDIKCINDGKYVVELPIGAKYEIRATKENYKSFSINLDLTDIVHFNKFERDIEMKQSKKTLELHVTDKETGKVMPVEIEIRNLDKQHTFVKKVRADENGNYTLELRKGDSYEININSQKGYSYYNNKIDASEDNRSGRMDIELTPLKQKTKLSLKNITFETNSTELDVTSHKELNRVVGLLKANKNIRVEISAHTDDVGSKQYNKELSGRRALSVINYLLKHGVTQNQMVSKGYGETKPLVPNNSSENRAKNRRVELEILDVKQENINDE